MEISTFDISEHINNSTNPFDEGFSIIFGSSALDPDPVQDFHSTNEEAF